MKEIAVKIYEFNELSDRAKEEARKWYRSCSADDIWWEFVYEDFTNICEILGIELKQRHPYRTLTDVCVWFRGFSSQGDGACFEGTYRYRKEAVTEIKEWAPQDDVLHCIADDLDNANKVCSEEFPLWVEIPAESMQLTQGAMERLMQWLYKKLQEEHEYLDSDDNVDENIRANEYTFLEDGTRFEAE